MYYDSSAMRIGLMPKKYATKVGFLLRVAGKGKSNYRINSQPLFEHYGIKLDKKHVVTPCMERQRETHRVVSLAKLPNHPY